MAQGAAHRVGFLEAGSARVNGHFLAAFMRGLRERGYVSDRTIAVDVRWADGQNDRFASLVAALLVLRPAVLVVASTTGALAAKAATSTVPVVFVGASDPVAVGLVPSLSHPGGNVTGLSLALEEGTIGKLFDYLKVLLPSATRIGLLWNPATAAAFAARLRDAEDAARKYGMTLALVPLRRIADLSAAFGALRAERVDAVIVNSDPLTLANREPIVRMATESRLPAAYLFAEFARAGGLLAYAPNVPVLFERAATYVDKILRGQSPADLPIEQPTAYELVINLKAASGLGLTVPASLLLSADELVR